MIKQYLRRKAMLLRGIVYTYSGKDFKPYEDKTWWDKEFYVKGVSDRQTIHADKHRLSARYHYNSVESLILEYLYNHRVQKSARLWGGKAQDSSFSEHLRVLDIGSGSGHWIDFYQSLGVCRQTGIEVSASAAEHLREKYSAADGIEIYHGNALEVIPQLEGKFDVVNAIGVMFHITDDTVWTDTINAMANSVEPNGFIVVGGHFGWLDGLNVAVDDSGGIIKRLRSFRHWKRVLKKAGFRKIHLYRNNAYLWINDPLPENSILVAEKGDA